MMNDENRNYSFECPNREEIGIAKRQIERVALLVSARESYRTHRVGDLVCGPRNIMFCFSFLFLFFCCFFFFCIIIICFDFFLCSRVCVFVCVCVCVYLCVVL